MKKINCEESCQKTKQMRCSSFCTKEAMIGDGKIIFGCDRSSLVGEISQEEENYLNCKFWSMGIEEQCSVCLLSCKNNKNEDFKKTAQKMGDIKNILDSFSPLLSMVGKSNQEISDIKEKMSKGEVDMSGIGEVVNLAGYAKATLEMIMSGKQIDLAEFGKMKDFVSKKYGNKV
jgi:hypothetical protein